MNNATLKQLREVADTVTITPTSNFSESGITTVVCEIGGFKFVGQFSLGIAGAYAFDVMDGQVLELFKTLGLAAESAE